MLAISLGLLVACGKTTSNDRAASDSEASVTTSTSSTTGSAGSAGSSQDSTTSAPGSGGGTSDATTATSGAAGSAPVCTSPRYAACGDACADLTDDDENCGYCGGRCSEGEHCVLARCEAPLTCTEKLSGYLPEEMTAEGGTALEDGWLLQEGDSLSLEHSFQRGPVVFVVRAKGVGGQARPQITLTVGDTVLGPLRLRSTSYAIYSLEYESAGGSETVSLATRAVAGEDARAAIYSLQVEDCTSLDGFCESPSGPSGPTGGYYLPEIQACVPPVCSEPEDCVGDFGGPGFFGDCVDGICQYPSCSAVTDSGLPLRDELASSNFGITYACLNYQDLTFPLNNPRIRSIQTLPSFYCPSVSDLTWEIERFAGEGSCVEVPICGPNSRSDLGETLPEPDDEACCYIFSLMCGA